MTETTKDPLVVSTDDFRAIVADQLGMSFTEVDPAKTFLELGADDLDMVEIAIATEEGFGVHLSDEDQEAHFRLDTTVGKLAETVHKLWN